MTIQLYNTLTQQKEVFTPIKSDEVTMYVCGPTVYNFVHIGNARPVVIFDMLFRLLQRHYPSVRYARNITDVDDKINAAAKAGGETIRELSERFTQAYHEDMDGLNTLRPTLEPRATDNIDAMIAQIQALIANGHAYESEGHVLFQVSTDPHYGKLSHRKLDEMIAGASERVDDASYKKEPADFVLWKPSSDDLPGWDSPWGRGRPGWHIECSAMINQHLGKTIDIHGGGQDLIFPHHENEIAQGTCCHKSGEEQFVRYWMHNGYLNIEGEKMSKSLGNFFTVRELLALWPGEVMRYALMTAHYRKPLDWTKDLLASAKSSLDRLYGALRDAPVAVDAELEHPMLAELEGHLCDDLATPQALAVLHGLAGDINKAEGAEKATLQAVLRKAGAAMGLLEQEADAWFKWQPASNQGGLSDTDIDGLIAERAQAKQDRNFTRADEIREQLKQQGITLEDSKDGTRWTRD
ncbi:cysteine--tRNA ligase [Ketobacter sp.]|uniref:cysteine--tRNA ligase n=1 Tax=Ketobacter sp. TaxID=2083498 RepID=UPI000F17B003|nr:cysteine--tRNA ligase [Ketobacter sp.]RLT93238.1 MAG: cysteine--tRNA ligase [Ketobacter sp.]